MINQMHGLRIIDTSLHLFLSIMYFTGYTLDGKPYTGTVRQLTTNGLVSKGGDMIWQNTEPG